MGSTNQIKLIIEESDNTYLVHFAMQQLLDLIVSFRLEN